MTVSRAYSAWSSQQYIIRLHPLFPFFVQKKQKEPRALSAFLSL
ncbi:hypothetical protein B4135_3082 [Caldibacillus debilis]|uniref:Uncharacterized protein n=1 Tax=Caldibacillus debilis TaxID=301148 RepID=A0A150LIM1_9BACI|nr:hypothetical protein B4135_3082 [Caldibacillus debilis]